MGVFEFSGTRLLRFRRVAVFGDLHGDYASLRSGLDLVDPFVDCLVFLGDYADRGSCGVEVIDAVSSLAKAYPENVFLLKGNHECYSEVGRPLFSPCSLVEEVGEKLGSWQDYFESTFKPFIDSLRLCVVIPDEMLFLHGGVSSRIQGLADLKRASPSVEQDVLWSDPFEGEGEWPNPRGAGVLFGRDVTTSVCGKLNLKRLVRSHEPLKVSSSGAPCFSHDRRVITTSTTTVYGGKTFLLFIDPHDFSVSCYEIGAGKPVKSKIVDCRQMSP